MSADQQRTDPVLFVRTAHANGETRYWVILGSLPVIEFEKRATRKRNSPVKKVEFIQPHELPGNAAEVFPIL